MVRDCGADAACENCARQHDTPDVKPTYAAKCKVKWDTWDEDERIGKQNSNGRGEITRENNPGKGYRKWRDSKSHRYPFLAVTE